MFCISGKGSSYPPRIDDRWKWIVDPNDESEAKRCSQIFPLTNWKHVQQLKQVINAGLSPLCMHACECACVCDLIHCVLICADLLATWLYSPFPTLYQKVRSLPGSSSVIHCHWHEKQADYYCNGVDGLRILLKKRKKQTEPILVTGTLWFFWS